MDTLKLSLSNIEIPINSHLQSKVDLPDYANDSKANAHITKNVNSKALSLEKAILQAAPKVHNTFCSHSGIGFTLSIPSELQGLQPSVCLPVPSLLSMASKATREYLYSLPLNILAGITLTALSSRSLLRSTDTNSLLSNSILCTAGKANLVESVMLYNLIVSNGIDSDTLPKLDITLATHYEGIANFEQPLSLYLESLAVCVEEQTASEATKRDRIRKEREEQAIMQRQRQEERKNKTLDSTYEVKRKAAYSALKDSTIDLYFLNYKKLVEVMTILVGKNGKAMKQEIKEKVLLRLNEILEKHNSAENKDLVSNVYAIKDFVTLSLTERVNKQVDSLLERASDLKTTNELNSTNKTLTLKEKLAIKKANALEGKGN